MHKSLVSGIVVILSASLVQAQIRLNKLVLESKEHYSIVASDILVVDTLIMRDSSSIFLNPIKKQNFIHAKAMYVGRGCQIIGRGKNGAQGKQGEPGLTQSAPCRDGYPGKDAGAGAKGKEAVNLSLYTTNLKVNGSLIIDLNGGDGGDGGKGGVGGDGGSGTRVCPAGNGGDGGNGAAGANGGDGGSVIISCKLCSDLHIILGNQLVVKNFGGFGGVGGEGGYGGQAGLGPVKDGRNGQKGRDGQRANQGKTGSVNLIRD